MATVSPMSTGKGLGSSNRTEQDQWDFSIPPSTDNQRFGGEPVEQYANGYAAQPTSPTRLDAIERSVNNGTPKSSRSKEKADPNYLSPYKQGLPSGSRSGSEPDSLLDLYGQRGSMREKSIDSPMPSPRQRTEAMESLDAGAHNEPDDPEQSRWIHKDKLAEIERREMEAAGIVPPLTRSKSRSRRAQSPEKTAQDEESLPAKESKRRRVKSPPEREPEQAEEETADGPNEFDIRTPEEIASDSHVERERTTSPVYRQQHGLRSSSSRIPLPRSSPMPLPQEHIERNTPLPRKRGTSGTWDGEDSILYNRSRSRGNSVGSQVLLDDFDTPTHNNGRPPSSGSPTKSRTPSSTNKHVRKPSVSSPNTPNSSQKPRSTSTNISRPKSRSGLEPRPPTAINRPEGDAPWLKDMYKPDPMLPPDQQLLPTHAKRLQEEARRQEQWEQAQRDAEERKQRRREGREDQDHISPVQKDFSPLAEYTANGLQPTPGSSHDGVRLSTDQQKQNRNSGSEWPLTGASGNSPLETAAAASLGTGDKIGNAGYSSTPRSRPGIEGGNESYRATVTSPGAKGREAKDPFEKERLARMEGGRSRGEKNKKSKKKNDDDDDEPSGGCCRCVIM